MFTLEKVGNVVMYDADCSSVVWGGFDVRGHNTFEGKCDVRNRSSYRKMKKTVRPIRIFLDDEVIIKLVVHSKTSIL